MVAAPKSFEGWSAFFDPDCGDSFRPRVVTDDTEYPGGLAIGFQVRRFRGALKQAIHALLDGDDPDQIPLVKALLELQKQYPVVLLEGAGRLPTNHPRAETGRFGRDVFGLDEPGIHNQTHLLHGDAHLGLPFLLNASHTGRLGGTIFSTRKRAISTMHETLGLELATEGRRFFIPDAYAAVLEPPLARFNGMDREALNDLEIEDFYHKILHPVFGKNCDIQGESSHRDYLDFSYWTAVCLDVLLSEADWFAEASLEADDDVVCVHHPKMPSTVGSRWILSSHSLFHALDVRDIFQLIPPDVVRQRFPSKRFPVNGELLRLKKKLSGWL